MPEIITISSKLVKDLVVPRLTSSKKGDNGTVLVAGGSRIYHGAPLLASMAALRAGTDIVYTAVPRSSVVSVRSSSPNIIALPLSDDKLTIGSANRLVAMIPKRADSAAIGMGMSIAKPEAIVALIRQLKSDGTKLLLDASALIPEVLQEISETSTIITPHPGEYKRIFGEDAGITEKERISNIDRLAKKYGITIVLKGSTNLVSSCSIDGNGNTTVIKRSTPAMTVGGTGDVLSGLTAGLLTKLKPFYASILGLYFNGLAASLAYKQVGLHMVATDLIEHLPNAMKTFDKINSSC
ncbi:MAG: NAD(P)H-hydrate dehydratase [Nitrososphaeraceae archaeon]